MQENRKRETKKWGKKKRVNKLKEKVLLVFIVSPLFFFTLSLLTPLPTQGTHMIISPG
jgi:hypothetical protein